MPVTYVIPTGKTPSIAAWCDKHISNRSYWLHYSVGGAGWSITTSKGTTTLRVDDPEMLTYAILKFGAPNG